MAEIWLQLTGEELLGLKLSVNVCSVTDNLTAAILSRRIAIVKDFFSFTEWKPMNLLALGSKIDLLDQ